MPAARALLIWAALGAATIGPLAVAANSPFLEWRAPVYILAGFAGVAAMALILVQPLLAGGYLPGLPRPLGRRVHRWTGGLLIACVLLHVAGLWFTSPPDVIDALLFTSPTPFSVWGVIAMWALFAAGMLALLRRPLHLRPRLWRLGHSVLVVVVALGSVVHALLIEGTMGMVSKTLLCILALAALAKVLYDLRAWTLFRR